MITSMSATKLQLIPIFRSFPKLVVRLTTDTRKKLNTIELHNTVSCHALAVRVGFVIIIIIAEFILLQNILVRLRKHGYTRTSATVDLKMQSIFITDSTTTVSVQTSAGERGVQQANGHAWKDD